jgi:two-component system, LytTR family, response regulator
MHQRALNFRRPPSPLALCLGGAILLWLLYTFVFLQTTPSTIIDSLLSAAANVAPLVALAAGVHAVLKNYVMPQTVPIQGICHAAIAIGFAIIWYGTVLVLLAFSNGVQGRGFAVSGFSGPAFTWQVFQGLIIYAGIGAACYALRGGRNAATVALIDERSAPRLFERYLIRQGDDIRPVHVCDIITISGAQDYSEVTTHDGVHLVRLSLTEFEQRLDPLLFLRVHRSTIIQFSKLIRAEPTGGGRMLAHMIGGHSVAVSRAGVQALRPFIV